MSRIAKWKLEKTKVKVVFRLQFHATHIPQTGWEKLFISFIPTESGKTTAKTNKANVRNGTCKWADPIYETTRLLQDAKSRQYDEKLYKLVVATGSSRSSILGEAIINLADYADALKPSSVALTLQGCSSGTILHVTVQLLTSKTGFREFEQQRELREGGLPMGSNVNSHDEAGTGKISSPEEIANDHLDKVNSRARFRTKSKELPSLEEAGLNEEYTDSAVGFDGSSSTSESLYTEKHDTSSAHEIDSLKSTVSGDLNGLSQCQSPHTEKGDPSNHRNLAQGSSDWVQSWGSDYSVDNDLAVASEENSRLRESLQVAESSIFELKLEVSSLQSNAEELGVETQKFAHQLAAEIASGEELGKEVLVLKAECSKFRDDLERLKNLKVSSQSTVGESIQTDPDHLLQDKELIWLKGLLIVEDRVRELQNKADLGFNERDFRFLRSDFEALLSILQDLKQGAGGTERTIVKEIRDISLLKSEEFVRGTGFDVGLYQPESMHYVSIPTLASQEPEPKGANDAINGGTFELLRQLEEAKVERENLARKMDQMECYYEALIQELEETQKQMMGELQNIRNEHSTCLYTISADKAEIESMRQEMNEQAIRFSEEKRDLDSLTKELERRANTSEAALKRARLNYSIAVDQLQKDLELLSFQVLSVYETNENLIKQTFSETSQPCFQDYPDVVQNPRCQNQVGVRRPLGGGDFHIEDLKRSLCLQEDLYKKVEEELCEMHAANLYLDVFSKALHETLLEANADIRLMKEKMDEFAKQFEISIASGDLLRVRLKTSMEEIQTLHEYKATSIAKASDMLLQNQILEEKLESDSKEKCLLSKKIAECEAMMKEYKSYASKYEACSAEKSELENLLKLETLENESLQNDLSSLREILEEKLETDSKEKCLLSKKIAECEAMMKEYKSYESKYEACSAEKSELENLLKLETRENENLQNEMSSLREELKTLKAGFGDMVVSKENLQSTINFLHDKLRSLLASYDEQFGGLPLSSNFQSQSLEFKDSKGIIMKLEEIQHIASKTILQLMEEKKNLEDDKGTIEVSLSNARSEILGMKQKFKHDVHDTVAKIDISNALVEKLQLKLGSVTSKFHSSSEVEEKFAQQSEEIFADLAVFEAELQKLTSKSRDLAQEILSLDTISEELERSKLTITELIQENHDLTMSLQGKTEESASLASQLNNLKESLSYLQDELNVERGLRGELEGTVADLTSRLSEEHSKLVHIDQQNAELVYFRQLASDLELEKARVLHVLLQHEERVEKLQKESSCFMGLESQLSEMHEYLVGADVELTFVRTHYETVVEMLVQKLESSDVHHKELQKKHLAAEEKLNCCIASEAHYMEENAKLVKDLESLRFELEANVVQNRVLSDSNNAMTAQLEECQRRLETLEVSFSSDINQHTLQEEQLKHMLENAEEDISTLILSKEELEIIVTVLKAKLDEQHARLIMLVGYNDESLRLRKQFNELTHKLSEQILKTEEFKNLSIHLKDLKDKAEAECLQARQKREPEGPSVAVQESLRIAFIKEQYETKLQELRQQLSISKKHGEEMLWKLQDVVDEIESRKKSEASHLKKNEEMSRKILELEAELQSVLSDKRERINDYDRIKAELECALLSLECCKEEKENLVASLQGCMEEKSKIAVELDLRKVRLENSTSPGCMQKEEDGGLDNVSHRSADLISGVAFPGDRNSLIDNEELQDANSLPNGDGGNSLELINARSIQGVLESKGLHRIPEDALLDQEDSLIANSKHLAVNNNHFRAQSLKSSMEHLHEELERMKNENTLLQTNFDPKFQDLQGEFTQLQKANQELGSIFPLFNELEGSGNALERVLALEIELAEALRGKKKSGFLFQSSFLKQHSDEEAVFRSFRDINELIKDMLELKGRYANVETDLKEMHDRYSQLSLQFAEVEGERQKLMMTLKNIRTPKKLIRSSSANLDHPS